jgi:hypothetical protein
VSAKEQFEPEDPAEEGRQTDRMAIQGLPGSPGRMRSTLARLSQYPSALANRPLRTRGGRPRWLRYAIRAVLVLVVLFVVVVGAALAVVLSGPTEFAFIRDRIQETLAKGVGPDYRVDVGRALVDVDPALGLVVEVDDVEVRDGQDDVVARAPSTRLALEPWSLLRLKVNVRTVELSGAELSIVRSGNGEVYLGTPNTEHVAKPGLPKAPAPAAVNDGGFPDLYALVRSLDRGAEPAVAAALKAGFLHFSLVDGTLNIWDDVHRQLRSLPTTDLSVKLDGGSGDLHATLATSGYGGRWTANVDRTLDKTTGGHAVSAVFSQITVADLFPKLGEETSSVTADIPLYGRATIHYAADGTILDANSRLDVGAGIIRYGDNRETMLLDEATLKLRWDLAGKVVVVEPSPVYFGDTRGVITGSIRPDGDPAARKYAFDLSSRGAVLAPSDTKAPPVVADLLLSGKADLPANLVTVENAAIVSQGGSIAAAGTIGIGGDSPTVAVAASATPMDVAVFKQMWVPFIAPGARRWVMAHIQRGQMASARFDAALPLSFFFERQKPPVSEDQMKLNIRLEDVDFTTFGELPAIRHASGNAVLAGSTFGVDLDKGEVPTPVGDTVNVDAGAFAIANAFLKGPESNIEVQLSGSAAGLGAIANADPIRALERRGMKPSDLSGSGSASVSIRVPLRQGVTEAEADWKVTINAKDLASKVPLEGRTFSDADVVIGATPDEVTIEGKAKIDGVPADLSLSQPLGLGGAEAGPGARSARLTLDDEARRRLGIGLDEILGGSVGATISNIEDGSKGQHYDLDLKRARVIVPGFGWQKAIGVPATLSFDLKPAKSGYSVDKIRLAGQGFGFTGTAQLDQDYGLVSADIDNFALHQGDAISFKLTRTKTGYAIVARGASFDMKGVIDQVRSNGDSETASPDVSIDARLDRLVGFNRQVLAGARLNLATTAGSIMKMNLSGTLTGSAVNIAYSDTSEGASLVATGDDAGKVFAFVDLYSRLAGGRLSVTAQRVGARGSLAGTFEVVDFSLRNEPAMRQVVASRGADEAIDANGTDNVHFDRMTASFRKIDKVINIDDALLRGATAGASFNGRIDLGASHMVINGTYIPAYNFNNTLSRVPLVGLVLGGGPGGGLFGVTFRIEGPLDGPRFFFNPLSVVTPGIFRKIFEFH